jgi:hypothetical protein
MLEILLILTWGSLIGYALWFYTSAKDHAPLTREELSFLWKLHKQNCPHAQENPIELKRKSTTVGFKCTCGYSYISKRPIFYKRTNQSLLTVKQNPKANLSKRFIAKQEKD